MISSASGEAIISNPPPNSSSTSAAHKTPLQLSDCSSLIPCQYSSLLAPLVEAVISVAYPDHPNLVNRRSLPLLPTIMHPLIFKNLSVLRRQIDFASSPIIAVEAAPHSLDDFLRDEANLDAIGMKSGFELVELGLAELALEGGGEEDEVGALGIGDGLDVAEVDG